MSAPPASRRSFCLPERLHAVPCLQIDRNATPEHAAACQGVCHRSGSVNSRCFTRLYHVRPGRGSAGCSLVGRARPETRWRSAGLTETTEVTALHRGTKKRSNGYRNEESVTQKPGMVRLLRCSASLCDAVTSVISVGSGCRVRAATALHFAVMSFPLARS